jgi:selenide, water dikinase
MDGAAGYAEQFIFPGGTANNKLFFERHVTFGAGLGQVQQMLMWDAQTSGGLLLAVPADRLDRFRAACTDLDQPLWVVGKVVAGQGIVVVPE